MAQTTAASATVSPQQSNAAARAQVLSQAINVLQPLQAGTFFPESQPSYTLNTRNVGIIKKIIVRGTATIQNTGNAVATLVDIGLANIISQITFQDFQGNIRIQTSGFHLALMAETRRRHFYGFSPTNATNGNNLSRMFQVAPASWSVFQAPPTIAAGATGTVAFQFEVPLCMSDTDLRGALFANVTNTYSQLTITPTTTPISAAGADATNAVYSGSSGVITSFSYNIYQNFLDQLPMGKNGAIVPWIDLGQMYELKQNRIPNVVAGNPTQIPFSSGRQYYSTTLRYNNGNPAAPRSFGTDVSYLGLQSASTYNFFQVDPYLMGFTDAEWNGGGELPAGVYYISHYKRPIDTQQYGNMQLLLNASTAAAGAYIDVYYEDLQALSAASTNTSILAG